MCAIGCVCYRVCIIVPGVLAVLLSFSTVLEVERELSLVCVAARADMCVQQGCVCARGCAIVCAA